MLEVRKQGFEPTVCIVRNKRQNYWENLLETAEYYTYQSLLESLMKCVTITKRLKNLSLLDYWSVCLFFSLIFLFLGEIYEIYIY